MLAPDLPFAEVMEVETPRLAHLFTEAGGAVDDDDGAAAAGLSRALSPAVSHDASLESAAMADSAHGGAAAAASWSASPPRRNQSFLSNPLSLQSNLVTPAVSIVHTPRASRSGVAATAATPTVQLATFESIPLTPDEDKAAVVTVAQQEGSEALPHNAATCVPDEDGAVLDVGDAGKRPRREHRSHDHFRHGVGEEGIECTSFGLDTSFMSATSSAGGPGGHHYASLYGAAFHIFKANVGAGVFLLPTYYQDAGYLVGAGCVVVLGAIMVDCAVSLLHVKHRINHVEVRTFPAVVEFVLGDYFQKFVQFALVFTQFGFCIMFLQYASSMLAPLVDKGWAYPFFIAVSTVIVTPMTFISNKLHLLVYASMLAGVFVLAVLAGTTIVDIENLAKAGVARGVVGCILTPRLLVFISGHMFSLEGIAVVLPVESSVAPEKRVKFGEVLRYTLVTIVSFYGLFGVLGYVAYGDKLHTSVVLALPPSTVKQALQVLLGLSLIFGFPIQYVPAIQIVDKAFGVSISSNRTIAFLLRAALNVTFGLIATFIGGDTINIFASFLGSFAGVHLMITVPTLLALQVEHALNGDRETHDYKDYLLLLFKGPYTVARCRYYFYLALAVVVWFGGLHYTIQSVFA